MRVHQRSVDKSNNSDGQKITLFYNSQNLIKQVTAPDGQTTTYQYDPTGQYLVSSTNQYGTTNYTYLTGQSNPALNNALKEVVYSNNTQLNFGYDSQGRLTDINSGNQPETISYGRNRLSATA